MRRGTGRVHLRFALPCHPFRTNAPVRGFTREQQDALRGILPGRLNTCITRERSWRVVYKSFSASSRNSLGTDRDSPNTTDPYPTASHPKRSRIMSIARSAVQRAIPFLVPGRRFSSLWRPEFLRYPERLYAEATARAKVIACDPSHISDQTAPHQHQYHPTIYNHVPLRRRSERRRQSAAAHGGPREEDQGSGRLRRGLMRQENGACRCVL